MNQATNRKPQASGNGTGDDRLKAWLERKERMDRIPLDLISDAFARAHDGQPERNGDSLRFCAQDYTIQGQRWTNTKTGKEGTGSFAWVTDAMGLQGAKGGQKTVYAWISGQMGQQLDSGAIELVEKAATPARKPWNRNGKTPNAQNSNRENGGNGEQPKPNALDRWKARREEVNQIDIVEVMEELAAELGGGTHGSGRFKLGGDIYIYLQQEQTWQNTTGIDGRGHHGSFALAHMALGNDGAENGHNLTLAWLEERFGTRLENGEVAVVSSENRVRRGPKDLELPERIDDLLPKIRHYLIGERGLPPSLVNQAIREGTLYASRQRDPDTGIFRGEPRCIFEGPASAEIREIGEGGFKGCCPGSQTEFSGFRIPMAASVSEGLIVCTEAAIDALAYRTLFPGRYAYSINGVGRFNLQYRIATTTIDDGYGFRSAMDADMAGDLAASKLFGAIFTRVILAERLGVDEDIIDEWFLDDAVIDPDDVAEAEKEGIVRTSGALAIQVDRSPHHLFFNSGWEQELPVHTPSLIHGDPAESGGEDDGPTVVWEDSGETAAPTVTLVVTKDIHPRLKRGKHDMKVSKATFDRILTDFDFRRNRTPIGKDWNDALLALGPQYIRQYETAANINFRDGTPPLPEELKIAGAGLPNDAGTPQNANIPRSEDLHGTRQTVATP